MTDTVEHVATTAAVISIDALRTLIAGTDEFALVDVREEGAYATGHPLLAVSLPLSQLELRAATLVPRPSAKIVVYDGGSGDLASRAADRLGNLGYTNVAVLDGGLAAWRDRGLEVFEGVNVLSKALGEFVEHEYETPRITVDELRQKVERGDDLVILDSRPRSEFEDISIPGGVDCPGAELVYRAHDQVSSPDTVVVVNCAGRTRAIIGAQALINAGFPNPVVSLENGTSAWLFAGFDPARGATRHAEAPSAEGLEAAIASAGRIAERFGVTTIDGDRLRELVDDAPRTLHLFDVRTPEEFEAGHLPGSRAVPGGQLVQTTDAHVGTQHARVVLLDGPDLVRATITASWLIQLGLDEVYVHSPDPALLVSGPDVAPVLGRPPQPSTIEAVALHEILDDGILDDETVVVDLAPSPTYRDGHIPGAWFAVRARLDGLRAHLSEDARVVLTSPDATLASFAAADAEAALGRAVLVLEGGTDAWRRAGLPLARDDARYVDEPDDVYGAPTDLERRRPWFRDYVAWCSQVVAQIERDGSVQFRRYP